MIRIHPSGTETVVEGSAAGELVAEIVRRFEAADDVLRLGVSEELIRRLRAGEAVELRFDPPREVTLARNGRRLAVGALLVPLEGELADGRTTIFYAAAAQPYGAGPMVHPGDPGELAALVEKLRGSG